MRIFSTFAMLAIGISISVLAAVDPVETTATSMVPRGTILNKVAREYTIKTIAGTKIILEFEINGKFQEASGLNLNKGDDFEPGMGLISLSTAAQKLVRAGQNIKGEWKLEKDSTHGWVYELAGESTEEAVFHLVNANSGQFIGTLAEVIHLNKLSPQKLAVED